MSTFVVPLGAKFYPEDHELMVYLSCKANGKQLPWDDFITEIDLYHIVDPGELFRNIDSKVDILYVFTKVKKMSENGKNVIRKVSENRSWKALDKGQSIYDEASCLVGQKRKFSFMNNTKENLGYHMTEFVLDKKSLEEAKFKDYVVCKIKRNLKKVGGGEPPLSVLPQRNNCCQYDGEQTLNENNPSLELPEDVDESLIQEYMNAYYNVCLNSQ